MNAPSTQVELLEQTPQRPLVASSNTPGFQMHPAVVRISLSTEWVVEQLEDAVRGVPGVTATLQWLQKLLERMNLGGDGGDDVHTAIHELFSGALQPLLAGPW